MAYSRFTHSLLPKTAGGFPPPFKRDGDSSRFWGENIQRKEINFWLFAMPDLCRHSQSQQLYGGRPIRLHTNQKYPKVPLQ